MLVFTSAFINFEIIVGSHSFVKKQHREIQCTLFPVSPNVIPSVPVFVLGKLHGWWCGDGLRRDTMCQGTIWEAHPWFRIQKIGAQSKVRPLWWKVGNWICKPFIMKNHRVGWLDAKDYKMKEIWKTSNTVSWKMHEWFTKIKWEQARSKVK